jgi:hypothetical protein
MKAGVRKRYGIALGTLALAATMLIASAGVATAESTVDPGPIAGGDPPVATTGGPVLTGPGLSRGFVQLSNQAFRGCTYARSTTLNDIAILHVCLGETQLDWWLMVPVGPPGVFYLVNQATGYCLEVNHGTNIPGERVDAFTCNQTTAEQWSIGVSVVDGTAYGPIVHAGTDLCLDAPGGLEGALTQEPCGGRGLGSPSQLWKTS